MELLLIFLHSLFKRKTQTVSSQIVLQYKESYMNDYIVLTVII